MTTGEYKRYKGLKKENLRDNMTNIELALNTLAEVATTEYSKQSTPQTMAESQRIAKEGGNVARDARKTMERRLGRSVISPERVSTWNHCLLKVAQTERNREKIIGYARRLYIEPYYEEGDFFNILKKNVPKEQWETFVRQLADDVLKSRSPERYAAICSSEGWHQKLMDFVSKQFHIGLLQTYEKQLLSHHRNEVIECYVRYIYHLMEYSRGRDTYREICNHLRHISSYGAEQLATDTALDLRTKYRRCRALLEELDRM